MMDAVDVRLFALLDAPAGADQVRCGPWPGRRLIVGLDLGEKVAFVAVQCPHLRGRLVESHHIEDLADALRSCFAESQHLEDAFRLLGEKLAQLIVIEGGVPFDREFPQAVLGSLAHVYLNAGPSR